MSEEIKISDIKDEYKAADLCLLPSFIDKYISDGRPGVAKLVEQAGKRLEKLRLEKERMQEMWHFENTYSDAFTCICGIDEAGRGPLAGPVVAAAVIFPKDSDILYVNDSKKLSAKQREELFDTIYEKAVSVGVGRAEPGRIDEINILQATYEAMREAVSNLSKEPDLLLNDAVTIPELSMKQIPIIKGDAKSASIAAASIIAKVTRDREMAKMDEIYPEYGFLKHKGYGTAEHIEALKKYGPSPIHRKSFIGNFI